MLDRCVVLFAVGLAFAQVFATPSNQDQLNGWYPCSNYTISEPSNTRDAECASYMAPLCYPGICNASDIADPTIGLFVKRYLATSGDPQNATNVWLLQGGPGSSSTGSTLTYYLHVIIFANDCLD
ncbi:Serine protease [Phytophthora megakarya]|uniref:Serine protease n=1 Tax=Phytophthora megakarya TaxID=4795 RepID=A0A225UFY0_9STRA|nr:Serine protease [Phytophthora megakarya]